MRQWLFHGVEGDNEIEDPFSFEGLDLSQQFRMIQKESPHEGEDFILPLLNIWSYGLGLRS